MCIQLYKSICYRTVIFVLFSLYWYSLISFLMSLRKTESSFGNAVWHHTLDYLDPVQTQSEVGTP